MDKAKRKEMLAVEILKYSRNELMVFLRFLDLALCKLEHKMDETTRRMATDGKYLYYNPKYIFYLYKNESADLNHAYLHSILHCVFNHPFVNNEIKQPIWNLACDIAVEGVINELHLKQLECTNIMQIDEELLQLRIMYGKLTAERLYHNFVTSGIEVSEIQRLQKIFSFDDHTIWYIGKSIMDLQTDLQDEWKELSERIQIDIETFSNGYIGYSAAFVQNLAEVNREKYDYTEFLKKFAALGEAMQINDDEFDYIFYTYGLQLYENVPLIEPLEYKEVKRIKEFVIAIDTSGSVEGELVQLFAQKTYNILKSTESFFSKINLHIIQCDDCIREDAKITSQEDFETYFEEHEIIGLGGTDFRPVFEYVDDLIKEGKFKNLKGLIYFTDGYGVFPKKKPDYDVAFVFVENEYWQIPEDIPPWVIKLILRQDEI